MEQALKILNVVRDAAAANRGALIVIIKVFTAAALLYFIVSYVDPEEIKTALLNADVLLLSAALLLLPVNLWFQYNRWKTACTELLTENNNRKIFYSLFYGYSTGIFTPMRVGEYFGRAIPFKNQKILDVTVASAVDKFFPLFIVLEAGAPAIIIYLYSMAGFSITAAALLMLLYIIINSAVLFLILKPSGLTGVLGLLKNISIVRKLSRIFEVLRKINRRVSLRMFYSAAGQYSIFILQYALLAAAFTAEYNLLNYIWGGMLLMFAKTVIPPVTLGELGIRESASVFFLTQLGGTAAGAFNASVFLFIINILIPSAAGMIMLLKKNVR